jgi:hypothetical protein
MEIAKKACTKCKQEKPITEYYRYNQSSEKLRPTCIPCCNKESRKFYSNNKDEQNAMSKERYKNNKVHYLSVCKKYRKNNQQKISVYQTKWAKENPDKIKAKETKYRLAHPDRIKKRYTENNRKRLSTPAGLLSNRVSSVMWHSLKNFKAGQHWEDLVGYTVGQLSAHLESLFLPGMSWDNMGMWHIDHKIPRSAFNYEKPEDIDFKKCWALKNLQPLWATDNIKKYNKLDKPFQPSLRLAV